MSCHLRISELRTSPFLPNNVGQSQGVIPPISPYASRGLRSLPNSRVLMFFSHIAHETLRESSSFVAVDVIDSDGVVSECSEELVAVSAPGQGSAWVNISLKLGFLLLLGLLNDELGNCLI